MICFDLLQLKILIFFSCVWHEFTREARELVSKCSILSSLFPPVSLLHLQPENTAFPSLPLVFWAAAK